MTLLHHGKWANADVYMFSHNGATRIYKGFDNRSFLVRWTIGALLTHNETCKLLQLAGLKGFPANVERCSGFSFQYDYIDGETLGQKKLKKRVPLDYFRRAERLLKKMHSRGIVHLDLRRGNNWMLDAEGEPVIIDFQSAVKISLLPRFIRKRLYEIDYSGLYKVWNNVGEAPLDATRRNLLRRVNRKRKLWILKGYMFQGKTKKQREMPQSSTKSAL